MSAMKNLDFSGVVRCGYLKKYKTSRKKYFVLRAESPDFSARLEYFDTERKFNSGMPPKRSIPLKNCFNINKRSDIKHKHVIALYTKDDCFSMVLDCEEELELWLKALLSLQHGEEVVDGEPPKPNFRHVWQVTVLNRGLGTAGITGSYRLCLTDKTLSLIKINCEVPQIELNLPNIRSCGNLKDFFFLEVGRSSTLGAGELWMQTEDHNIAHNVHSTVFHAMSTNSMKEELGPKGRHRSSSATESSKPQILGRKPPQKYHILPQGLSGGRERCDSMPSRARTTSEGTHQIWTQPRFHHHRPVSLYNRDISHSPPSGSPPSVGCSTDSAGSSYSLADDTDGCNDLDTTLGRYSHSLTPDEVITEEDCPDSPPNMLYGHSPSYMPMAPPSSDDGYVAMYPKGHHHNNSPTASMSSVTSGTPSTDMRFAEYPLEKVTSYIAPPYDDDTRPNRAYSVGSKPETYKKYLEMLGSSLRVRALSVGSKTKKIHGRVLPPHGLCPHHGAKSSSAPILSNTRSQGSHSSIGPMDDLMEMDFSRSGSTDTGYMEMKPGNPPNHTYTRTTNSGYVEMKPGIPSAVSPYVEMKPGTSPAKKTYISNDYMEMDRSKNNNNNNHDYLDMSKTLTPQGYQLSPAKTFFYLAGDSPCGLSHMLDEAPRNEGGYVEMSLGKGRGHQRQSSVDVTSGDSEDSAMKTTKKKKTRSQPIAIQQPVAKIPSSSSSSPIFSLLGGRKFSTGTPPKMHLALAESPYSSFPRQRTRKTSRRDSKDSSSSSVTTPSSSSIIFSMSLNSPCSPVEPPVTIKVPSAVLNTVYKKGKGKSENSDYTPMNYTTRSPTSDYVNFSPKAGDDYAVMDFQQKAESTFKPIVEGESPGYEMLRIRSLSRPSSTSSELCSSSGSTVVGSRPDSVNSDRARPASGGFADVQLHYASLDLEDGNRSPRTVKGEGAGQVEATLTYAAIDFHKSEGLKHNTLPTNAKVKH